MAALRAALLARRDQESLCTAAGANLDILPHQLEPALAMVQRGARRLLLADAVGLGKTVEAGLALAELRARAVLDRALVLAPPGLCDQWCAELSDRFGLEAVVADAGWLRGLRPVLPPDLNPWSIPGIRVASLDFTKRPEVRRSIEHVSWDAVVVDEAHRAAGDSERRAAAHAFAARARFVLLLTATPHSGDARAFQALCGIGALAAGDPLVMFRRTRGEAGLSTRRRVHLHRVEPAAAELAVRRQLDDYISKVWRRRAGPDGRDARLAMVVLLKRSLSGMGPLRRSLLARLDRLGTPSGRDEVQLPFLWEADEDADAAPAAGLGAPGFDDEHEERRVLRALADGAACAEAHDSKRRALVRLLARVREPVIVFTEYRDTLEALHAALGADTVLLHGAMDRFERAAAVHRFTGGGARVLLATDAAGEGLNLQSRCRLVINLELPWNPMRLEQRVGRVDRIGQQSTVHAINLLAARTAESDILLRLAARLDRARSAVGEVETVLGRNDERVMAACLGLEAGFGDPAARPVSVGRKPATHVVRRVDLGSAAREAAARLERQRQLLRASRAGRSGRLERTTPRHSAGILATAVRSSRLTAGCRRSGLLVVFRIRPVARAGRVRDEELVPVFAEGPCPRLSRRCDVRARASDALATLVPAMAAAIPPPSAQAAGASRGFDRDAHLARRAATRQSVQRGLFEHRAEREADSAEVDAGETAGPLDAEHDGSADPGSTPAMPPEPALLLFVTS